MGRSTTDGPTVIFQETGFRVVRPRPDHKKPDQQVIFEHQLGFDAMLCPIWLPLQPFLGLIWLARLLGPERSLSDLLEREGIKVAPGTW